VAADDAKAEPTAREAVDNEENDDDAADALPLPRGVVGARLLRTADGRPEEKDDDDEENDEASTAPPRLLRALNADAPLNVDFVAAAAVVEVRRDRAAADVEAADALE
jgi:hypothetical protein